MAAGDTDSRGSAYVGVGCLMAVIGLAGGGMIAVLVAKIVGAIRGCVPDAETGAPCGWFIFAAWGAVSGLIILPSVAIWRMRHGKRRELLSGNTETG
jgi:hypothetical protein